MSKLKAVLIDLSGTLHVENELIPGSIEALIKFYTIDILILLLLIFSSFGNKMKTSKLGTIPNQICDQHNQRIQSIFV
jgi:ribonucleotide monophosphatase NagD (HAD superfamily)